MPQHRHQAFLAFLTQMVRTVPDELAIHVILDNYATHKHAAVQRWLARRGRGRSRGARNVLIAVDVVAGLRTNSHGSPSIMIVSRVIASASVLLTLVACGPRDANVNLQAQQLETTVPKP